MEQIISSCLEALKAAEKAISDELDAAGEDEVRQHPILSDHVRALEKVRAALTQIAGSKPAPEPAEVLSELLDLLGEWAPVWYTDKLRARILTALKRDIVTGER